MHGLKNYPILAITLVGILAVACSGKPYKPCSEGGQPSREDPLTFRGIKRCHQVKDKMGTFVNDGIYREWYNSDNIALEGEYKMGKKTGRWVEYDQKRIVISDKWFLDGKEVPAP